MSFGEKAVFASLPRVTRGLPTVLKGDPKGKNFLYTNGKSVFIRDIQNPTECDIYTQHAKDTTVAVYAPSGFYIASGDVSGKLRIWDTINKEHLLKYDYQPLARTIKDIAWSPDSKRIVTVGDGNENYAAVFLWDSGSNVGGCPQHSKMINAVDYRPERPYRICTASEDFHVNFYEGPPFKYKRGHSEHTNFVNCVKYSPDGSVFVSGGADGKLVLYEGKDGEVLGEFGKDEPNGKAHKGGVYGISFSKDGKHILTASADRTCKIWSVADKSLTKTFQFGSDLEDMQVGCLWQGDNLLSVSLSGYINYLDQENPDTPKKIIMGHYKNITAVTTCQNRNRIYSASFDGRIISWDEDGNGRAFKGKGHTNQVSFMAVYGEDLITCGLDDTVRFTSLETETFGSDVVSLDGQPKGLSVGKDGLVVVPLPEEVVVLRNKKLVSRLKVHYEPSSASVHPGGTEVAIGAQNERYAYIYSLENDTLVEKTKAGIESGNVLLVAYSPDGAYLGVSNDSKKSYCLMTSEDYKDKSGEWYGHTAKIFSLAWSPDSKFMATGGLDTNVFIYNPEEPTKKALSIKFAHPQSAITTIAWLSNTILVSGAQDCCLKLWEYKVCGFFHQFKMADTNKRLPPDWHDDDRMNFMFSAFPEHRRVNPKHWDSKLQFWRKLILENCDHNHELCVDFETLRRRFTRNGLVPLGLQTVLEEMLKTGELQTLDSFTSALNNTWLSWGVDIAKKSLSWTVGNLLWGNDMKGKLDGSEFIIADVLKNKSESLMKMHKEGVEYEATDHIIPWNVLKARCNKGGLKLTEKDLDLVVCYLQRERKVSVHLTNEGEKVIKFIGKNESTVSTLNEKDLGILRIKKTMASLTLEINKLEKTSESCKQKAKEFSSKGLKKSALTVLKKKASIQKTLDKSHGSLHTLEELLHRIQQANTDKMIIDTLKSGSSALKAIQEELSAEDVDKAMLDLEQTLDDAEDIQQAIAQGNQAINDRSEDENIDALEKELAALSLKSDGNTLTTEGNEKISTAEEAASVPIVPGGTAAWTLPEPPTHSPSKPDQHFERERRREAIKM